MRKHIIARLQPQKPEYDPGFVHVEFVVDEVTVTGFPQSTSVFPRQYHSLNNP